ncbi:MAG: ammonia-forming cytochrome c nitrite reductase subunit c552 [Burkholderiales bacterium]|nr:ammonia-forming cytochrome c nitrite reductase subunit c552 [Burkholderiales bacterium]
MKISHFAALSRIASSLAVLAFLATPALAQQPKKAPAKKASVDASACYACHAPIKDFHTAGKHAGVGCNNCHTELDKHLADSKARPTTKVDPAACGTCHENQFKTMYKMNWDKPARFEKSQAIGPSPNPAWDKLMAPHGFTKEHNVPRSHAFMVLDQFVVDRAFGGRFEPKDGWQYLTRAGGNFKVGDAITDLYPGNSDHKPFKPGTAAAANPVCLNCKTQDHILDWAYMGDPVPTAKWSRTSKVVEMARSVNHALNCFFCHDPHSAKPRIVRDALIQALTRPEKDTLWHQDKRAAKIDVKDLGVRGHTRKIALLDRYDTKLQCAQCHVEYNCNPGTDPTTGQPVGMSDQRTNHFPFKDVNQIAKHYNDLKFRDFKHGITGALLWKGQHPDVENYYNSKHQNAGVECHQCHMPKVKDAKTGKTYTSHWQTSPKHYIKETCLQCHGNWDEKQAKYVMDSLNARMQGKLRKAEYWLTRMVDKFEEAKAAGVTDTALNPVREKHYEAQIHWEWWTASNGAAFHNPDAATDSINKSMSISQEAIKMLEDAMAARRGAAKAATAPAAPGKK